MATQFELIIIVVVAVFGGVLNALLGWSDSGEPFNARKFFASVVRAAIGAVSAAFVFQGITNVDVFVYLQAFLAGAGVDVTLQRIQKVLQQPNPS